MKNIKIGILILFGFFYSSGFSQVEWGNYEYPEHHFKISFIEEPVFSIDTSDFLEGQLLTYNWMVNVEDEEHSNSYYYITSTTYPSDYIHSDSTWELVEGFINSTQNSSIENEMLEIGTVSNLILHGYKGKEFKWNDINEEYRLRCRVYLINNNLVELGLIIKKGLDNNVGIAKFFDSFEIIDLPKGNYSEEPPKIEKKYEIKFTETPQQDIRNVDSDLGVITLYMESVEPKGKSMNFMMMASQTIYPEPVVDEQDTIALNEFYKNSMDGSLKGTDSELINSKDIYYKGKLGKEFRGSFRDGMAVLHYRIFLIDNVLYMQGGMTRPIFQNNPELIKFLDSFKIKE